MVKAAYLLVPLALIVPGLASLEAAQAPRRAAVAPGAGLVAAMAPPAIAPGPVSYPVAPAPTPPAWQDPGADQVRIEQHITIRISPRAAAPMPMMPAALAESADAPAAVGSSHFLARKFGRCVAAGGITGAQPAGGNQLILFLRDGRMLAARMEKSCNVRDFYSGFLVQRSADGMICAKRDVLLSRSGTNCRVGGFRQLIEVGE